MQHCLRCSGTTAADNRSRWHTCQRHFHLCDHLLLLCYDSYLMSSKTDASDGFYRSIGQIPSPMKNYTEEQKSRRRWRWIGHVLRQQTTALITIALRWTPDGQRKRGRPKETWRRTVEREMKEKGWTWGRLERVSADRHSWRALVEALCAT